MGPWLILVEALLFILVFGAFALFRKEPLPMRSAYEILALTALVYIVYFASGFLLDPLVFLLLIYIVTMRSRLLVDLGNVLAGRGRFGAAYTLYDWAQRVGPDQASRTAAQINLGACLLREHRLKESVQTLQAIATRAETEKLGAKLEGACRYNLGLALMRNGQPAEAVRQLNLVVELLPASMYGLGARAELKRYREGAAKPEEATPDSADAAG